MHLLELLFGGRQVLVHDRRSSSTTQGVGDASADTLSPQPGVSKPQPSSNLPPYIQLYQPRANAVVYVPGAPKISSGLADGHVHGQREIVLEKGAGQQRGDDRSALLEPAASPVPASSNTLEFGATPTSDSTSPTPPSLKLTPTHEVVVQNGTLPTPIQTDQAATSGAPLPSLKNCRSRACTGVVDSFKRALRPGETFSMASVGEPLSNDPNKSADLAIPTKVTAAEATAGANVLDAVPTGSPVVTLEREAAGSDVANADSNDCPPDTWQLGRATWTFLHSAAAHYPEQPSPRQQEMMRGMVEGLAEFYPCEICAEHLREQVRRHPPQVATAKDLNLWLCGIHNEVNEMLGKPRFDCSQLMKRWRDGPPDGSCD